MLAALLLRVGEYEEAREMARKACRLGPHLEDTHLTLATVYRRMRQLDKALAEAKRAASIDPDSPDAALLVAILAREMGDPVKAQGDLRQILARPLASDVKVRALRTLGFALDDLGEYPAAFKRFEQAGVLESDSPGARRLDRDAAWREIDEYTALTERGVVPSPPHDDDLPVPTFLVGFPRSGTTMLGQILAAHPKIVTADERPMLRDTEREIGKRFGGYKPEILPDLKPADVARARAFYWQRAEVIAQRPLGGLTFIDKLPLNIKAVPLINLLFPEARLLVALRDPRDVCLSCFMQEFALNVGMVNFLSWGRTAAYYAKVMGFWLHLRDKTTLAVAEVKYEGTVGNLEAQARRLLHFLDLEWDERVLAFHRQAAVVGTPSSAAVAEPVHRGAVGRWKNYREPLRRVEGILSRFIEAFGYETIAAEDGSSVFHARKFGE